MNTRPWLVVVALVITLVGGTSGWFSHGGLHNTNNKRGPMNDPIQMWKQQAKDRMKNHPPAPGRYNDHDNDSKDKHDKDSSSSDTDSGGSYSKDTHDNYNNEKYYGHNTDKGSHSKDSDKGSHSKDSDKGTHSKDSDKRSHSKDSDKGSHSKDSDKGSHRKDSDKGSHSKDSDKGSHSKDSDKGSHSKDSDKGSHSKDSDKGSQSKDSDKRSHSKDNDKGSHSKDSDKGSHSKASDKHSHSKDNDKGSHSKDSDKHSHTKGSDKRSHSKDSDKGSHSKDSDKGSHSKDSDTRSHSKGSDKGSHSKDSDTRSHSKDGDKSKETTCHGKSMWKKCESWGFKYDKCYVTEGTITSITAVKQESKTTCKQGVNWGYKESYIWVDHGCRANFEICVGETKVNGEWSTWSDYGSCTKTCGTGSRSRSRTCSNPPPSNNGLDCVGDAEEDVSCNTNPCPVDGGWTSWSNYGACTKTCGPGIQARTRSCTSPEPANNGADCVGNDVEERICNTKDCPVNGGWTRWSDYGPCTKTCGTGSRIRSRTCSNPPPSNNGLDCVGDAEQEVSCNTNPCPVDGGWTPWTEYGACDKTCGTGRQSRSRSCTNPEPANNGADCVGDDLDERICNTQECPVNGGWSRWSDYGSCTKTCGTGSRSRSRTCSNPPPSNNGLECVGDAEEEASCNTNPCPVNGGWTPWSDYDTCTKTCGSGIQARRRSCSNPEPANNGAECVGNDMEERVCNTKHCPVNGEWSHWSVYSPCSKTCATGSQTRSRSCTYPPPTNGGEECIGEETESQSCNTDPCPFEEECTGVTMVKSCESSNNEYNTCEFSLGQQTIKGVRVDKLLSYTPCKQGENWGFNKTSVGVDEGCRAEFELCLGVDGSWSPWSSYGECSKTCGGGKQSRSRTCSDPAPSLNGADCIGHAIEQICCNKQPCPVNGGWSTWGEYSPCSKTCGNGTQARERHCNNPFPVNNGTECEGNHYDEQRCNTTPCPVDGGWGNWTDYEPCSKTCGGGTQTRFRTCNNPPPAYNGTGCIGKGGCSRSCNTQPCQVDGGWSSWSEYGACSKACGSGSQSRERSCTNPAPANNGAECIGTSVEERNCTSNECPVGGGWSSWTAYGSCSKTCGGGARYRNRSCTNPPPSNNGADCVGRAECQQSCNTQPCPINGGWTKWTEYSACSTTCSGGGQTRTRTCTNPPPSNNGSDCEGEGHEVRLCNMFKRCPVDGGWSSWSNYTSCSTSCGSGKQSRTRTCSNPEPSDNGADCVGNAKEYIICNTDPCLVDGGWSTWTSYGPCSKSCGSGKQSRTRTCTNPPPSDNGAGCTGDSLEERMCNSSPCPTDQVDGGWSKWSRYEPCSKSCGSGKQSRTRTCTNPSPSGNGAECVGMDQENRDCNSNPCPKGKDTMKPPYRKPKACHIKEPCCEQGQLKVNLGSRKLKVRRKREGALKGVKVGKISRGCKNPCSQSVVITVDFESIDNNSCFGCLQAPYCGRRMLKIDLELSNAGRKGWLINIGDSQSNDGTGNDASHQENNAEVAAQYPNITVYPSNKCQDLDRIMHIIDGCTSTVNVVTLYVSNEHVRITNSDGLDYHVCSGCLFALNGQSDDGTKGVNERVHIGLNRVLAGLSRVGYGVCSATLTWACPWCD